MKNEIFYKYSKAINTSMPVKEKWFRRGILKNFFRLSLRIFSLRIIYDLNYYPCLVTPLINFFNINMFPVWISSKSYTFSLFCWVKYVFKKKRMLPAGELSNFPLLGKDDDLDGESKLGPGELVKFCFHFFQRKFKKISGEIKF